VFFGSNRSGALAAVAIAAALCGCANNNFDTSGAWFSKPLDLFGRKAGYTYSSLGESKLERPVTANDLVDANGACPIPAAPSPTQATQDNAAAGGAAAPDMASLLGGGVAIGMSECDVVARLGQPSAVNLGRNPNGERSAVLTFNGGPRPGVYRFEAGRLTEMDRVEAPAPPAPVKKTAAKKKPMKPSEPPKSDDKT
jgi:hypothetical protein